MQIKTKKRIKQLKEAVENGIVEKKAAFKMAQTLLIKEREKNIMTWLSYYLPGTFNLKFSDIAKHLFETRHKPFRSLLAPREHAKTTLTCKGIPLYQALVEPDEYKHYLNIQNTTKKAVDVNLSIRIELETNDLLRRDYGDMTDIIKWTEKQFMLKNGVVFSAIGAGESVRGVNFMQKRPDYIMADDIYDDEDMHNTDRLQKKESWFWSTIYPARASAKKCCIHIQGTAINKLDLMHKTQENPNFVFKIFKAVIDWDKKKTLWHPFKKLEMDKFNMGSTIFNREFQNECRDDESSIIKEAWLQYYDEIPGDEIIDKKIGCVDPAIGEKKTNDYTGKSFILRTKKGNFYIHEVKEERLSFNANMKDCKNWHERVRFDTFRIEEISGFQAFGQYLKENSRIPIKEIKSVKDKISRLEAVSHFFENKKVFINREIPIKLRNRLVEQLINNHPNHDDIRDSVVLGLEDSQSKSNLEAYRKIKTKPKSFVDEM